MQENLKQVKRAKTLNIIAICLLLVLFTASLFLAVIAPVFSCKVASAADSPAVEVTDLQSQASSDYILQNIATYPKLYGVFVNKDFTLSYADCLTNDSFFSTSVDSGSSITIESSGSNAFENRHFSFRPLKITNEFVASMDGTFSLTSPVYGLWCSVFKNADDFGSGFTLLIYKDIADYNSLVNWEYSQIFGFGKSVVTMFDLDSIPKASGVTYSDFVPSLSGMTSDMLDFWSDFIYLSLPRIGGESISASDSLKLDNFKFYSRFITPVKTPSRKVYFNLNTYPTIPAASFFKSAGPLNQWMYCDYFQAYNLDGGWYAGNNVVTVGWELYYRRLGTPQDFTTDYTSAILKCNGTKIFSYDCAGDSIDNLILSNPKWFVSANLTIDTLSIYLYDFSGASPYFTFSDTSPLISEQFSNSCWGYSFALQDLNNWSDLSNDVYYNNGYNEGFKGGKTEGYSTGKTEGYSNGFAEGKKNGYDIGYNAGVNAGQDYSFSALLGAVFDVPIQAFKGLFNFEIFGVNMTSFVSSLLALCVIVVIVKICLGGK